MPDSSPPRSGQPTTLASPNPLARHLRRLDALGLHVIPGWGGGKAFPGTDHRALADNPPSLDQMLAADYTGGLSVICGTQHPQGGYVVGSDVDDGPETWPAMPRGFLYLEAGTKPSRSHVFVRTTDRLDGQLVLRDAAAHLVAELKGRGLALRSWPTRPPAKPRGYTPLAMALNPATDPPALSVYQLAEGMSDYLSRVLGRDIYVDDRQGHHHLRRHHQLLDGAAQQRLAHLVEQELARHGVVLRPAGRDGWQQGRCPLHDDHSPSFSVNFELGAWKCWSGCGSGGLRSLAERLGLTVYRWRRGHVLLPEAWA